MDAKNTKTKPAFFPFTPLPVNSHAAGFGLGWAWCSAPPYHLSREHLSLDISLIGGYNSQSIYLHADFCCYSFYFI